MKNLNALQKSWRYIRNYKKLLSIVIIAMFCGQLLGMLSPLIVKSLLDDNVLGVMKPYYKVLAKNDKTIEYNHEYFKQEQNLLSNESKTLGNLSVFYFNKSFYVTPNVIKSGNKNVINDSTLIVTNEQSLAQTNYPVKKISLSELKDFYRPHFNSMAFLLLLLLVRPLLSAMFGYIQRINSSKITIAMTKDGRNDAAECIHKIPIKYFEAEPVGKTTAKITHDISGITQMLDKILNLGFSATFSFILAYYFMFKLDAELALASFVLFPIYMVWIYFFTKSVNKRAVRINELSSMITAKLNENINGVNIIKAFSFEKGAMESFNQVNEEFVEQSMGETKLHVTYGWNLISFLNGMSIVAVVGYFGFRQLNDPTVLVTAGLIYAYVTYIQMIINPLSMLFKEFGNIEHAIVKTNRFYTILDEPKEESSYSVIPRYKGEVEFENLWFAYLPLKYVLKGINIKVKAGSMCGIVGHTGSGKTTLMNLLMRFYDMGKDDLGRILIDGIDIHAYSKRTYRQHIGIILQEPILFRGTLASNIRYGNADLSDKEVTELLANVGGQDMLTKFPDGIHQQISRGGDNLSLGEKQIISFARVLAINPAILIMDEATANIDTGTEMMIQNALNVVSQNRTVIVIAHRLSTIKKADKIIVLESGEKIEEGNHEELMQLHGKYMQMYQSQGSLEC